MGDPTEEMMGLGGYIPQAQPQQPAGSQPTAQGNWSQFLADPVNRAGLLSFGLQALTGGWGNGAQQMAQSIGAGAQGMAGTAKSIQEQGTANRDFAAKQEEGAANRASHEKIAQTGADSRLEVAQTKTEGMLARAALIHGPQNNQEMKIYADAHKAAFSKYATEAGNPLSPFYKMDENKLKTMADAQAKQVLDGARNATGVRSQGSALPGDSANGSGLTDKSLGAGQQPAIAGKPSNATSVKPSFQQLMGNVTFQRAMTTEAGRAQVLKERPELAPDLEAYMKRPSYEN